MRALSLINRDEGDTILQTFSDGEREIGVSLLKPDSYRWAELLYHGWTLPGPVPEIVSLPQ